MTKSKVCKEWHPFNKEGTLEIHHSFSTFYSISVNQIKMIPTWIMRLIQAFTPSLICWILPLSTFACFPKKEKVDHDIEMEPLIAMEEGKGQDKSQTKSQANSQQDYGEVMREYALFIWSYVQKTNYIPTLLRNFAMSFVTKTILTYFQAQLFASAITQPQEAHFILGLVLCRIINLADTTFDKIRNSRNEKRISREFQLTTFHRKAKVPYTRRKESDIHELATLESDVEEGVINVIAYFFQSIISMISDGIIVTTLFIKSDLLWILTLVSLFLYTTIRYVVYPRMKENQKKREVMKERRREINRETQMLKFGFEEFPEKFKHFENIQKSEEKSFDVRLESIWMNATPHTITKVASELSLLFILGYTYVSRTRNYFIPLVIVPQLFALCTEAVVSVVNMEETIEKYQEYQKAYRANDETQKQAEKEELQVLSYEPETQFRVSIPLYQGYTLQTSQDAPYLKFRPGDKIFITGASGQGKTTLAEKLSGRNYYDPEYGNRRLCTYYLPQDYNKTWTQSPYKISAAFPGATLGEVIRILRAFQYPLQKLKSYDNEANSLDLSEIFPVMSGGELKRLQYAILMTRDLTPAHQMIILDEPHKELDLETASKMVRGIESLYPERTMVVIQHHKPETPEFAHWREWHIEGGIIRDITHSASV